MERRAKRGAQLLAEGDEVEVGCEIRGDKGEFVAAQSRQMDILRLTANCEPLPDLDEELVASRMAVEVVHRLEAVEVEHTDRKLASAASRRVKGFRQIREERAPVRQIGKTVEIGEAKVFVAEGFGPNLRID